MIDSILVTLTEDQLDPSVAIRFVSDDNAGGTSLFIGSTRRRTGERVTTELYYESYITMAQKEMRRLCEEALKEWPILKVALFHRLGTVPVGEASVVVAVSSPHRDAAFKACRNLIDQLKESVPIWKREMYEDGSQEWVQPMGEEQE